MAGQFIKLPGVTAASTGGAPRITMSEADAAALRVPSLHHVVSAGSLTASAAGVSGNCRKTGKALVPKGAVTALQLRTVAGHVGVGLATASAAGLALPVGSATASYTAVATIQLSPADITSASAINAFSTFTAANTLAATILRYYGNGSANPTDKFVAYGSDSVLSGAAIAQRAAGDWVVVVVDFNDNAMTAAMSVNGGAFVTAQRTAHHAPGADGQFEIGYHLSASSLRGAMVGELYLFNDSLLKTPLGQTQLAAVIAGLKADYGIA